MSGVIFMPYLLSMSLLTVRNWPPTNFAMALSVPKLWCDRDGAWLNDVGSLLASTTFWTMARIGFSPSAYKCTFLYPLILSHSSTTPAAKPIGTPSSDAFDCTHWKNGYPVPLSTPRMCVA